MANGEQFKTIKREAIVVYEMNFGNSPVALEPWSALERWSDDVISAPTLPNPKLHDSANLKSRNPIFNRKSI